jgi:hypothetical protein
MEGPGDVRAFAYGHLSGDLLVTRHVEHNVVCWPIAPSRSCAATVSRTAQTGHQLRRGASGVSDALRIKRTLDKIVADVQARNAMAIEHRGWATLTRLFCMAKMIQSRGRVCERWRSFSNFNFDVGKRPTRRHLVIRDDPTGTFEPDNARWKVARLFRRQRANPKTR